MSSQPKVSSRLVPLLCLLLGLGCASPTYWDLQTFEARNPRLSHIEGQRLGDITPYFFPHQQRLYAFTCRWPDKARVQVWLSPEATPEEVELLDFGLKQFSTNAPQVSVSKTLNRDQADIVVEFATESRSGELGLGTGSALVDCQLSVASLGSSRQRVDATLVRADVLIARRTPPDVRDRTRLLTQEEKLGALVHELGHAMGFQGHVQNGRSVMTANRDEIVLWSRAVLRGEQKVDPNLRALYALPSGSVLAIKPLAREQTALIDGFVAMAKDKGYQGPYLRVGDQSARLVWEGAQGGQAGFILLKPQSSLLHPEKFVLFEDF
ncbi:MAG: hypothetical protein JRC77_09515 [Deltaproteobacteria bacterium]|nr:hypothetical protein [Deltaproteobacteria bacterium]